MFWSLNFLDPFIVLVCLQLLVARKQRENVAVISSNIAWLAFAYLMLTSILSNSDGIWRYLSQSQCSLICKDEKGLSEHERV